ncbi:type II secretion system F family protein [Roseospira visakhapatnamensis]|uniref:Tight adherence protein B n=1 Tax=Roseospira visakhapatnamensis TaxID=390880 RepID=A0A7W6RFV5_9PROT|nr:tight adherence protein B [Roseospira visakhapatnamensis]
MTNGTVSPELLLLGTIIALTVMVLTLVAGVIYAWGEPRRRLKRRIADLGLERSIGAAGGDGSPDSHGRQRRIQDKLREIETATQKRAKRRNRVRSSLLQAGLTIRHRTYIIAVSLVGIIAAVTTYGFGFSLLVSGLSGLVASVGLPRLVLALMARSRRRRFTAEFPNAIDVLVRGVRSGLPVSECITIVGREIADPVGTEFRLLMEGQRVGMSLEDIMDRALARMPTAEFRFFAVVLQIQQQTGGNLAETLAKLSSVIRERKKMRDRAKALSSEAKASALIIGSMPVNFFVLVYFLAPDYMGLMITEEIGHYMIFAGVVSMIVGSAIMKVMIDFKM